MTPTESGTPRVDAVCDTRCEESLSFKCKWCILELARQLERELAEKQAEGEAYAELQARCFDGGGSQSVFDRVKELEAALTAERQRAEGLKRNLQNMLDLIDANTDVADWDEADEDAVLSARAALAARQEEGKP